MRGGQCVRLYQGSYEQETGYYDDPVKMAKLWRIQNTRVLHVVDLDAARGGSSGSQLRSGNSRPSAVTQCPPARRGSSTAGPAGTNWGVQAVASSKNLRNLGDIVS